MAADRRLAQVPRRGRRRARGAADLHRGSAADVHDHPVRHVGPGSGAAPTADVGGRQLLSPATPADLRHRPPDRRDAGRHRDVGADHPGPAGPSSEGGVGRPGVRAHHRGPVLQHDLLGAVPTARLLPLAAGRRRPRPRHIAITGCSCSTCSPASEDRIVNGCWSHPRTCGNSTGLVIEYPDAMRDPFATVRTLYTALGRELAPATEQRMRVFRPPIPGITASTGVATGTAGRTPAWTPGRFVSRCAGISSATASPTNRCGSGQPRSGRGSRHDLRGPRMSTEPHTTLPVRMTCGLPSAGASLRWS